MANPATIYKRFCDIFPDLASKTVCYRRNGNSEIVISMEDKSEISFNYGGKTWKLEKKR